MNELKEDEFWSSGHEGKEGVNMSPDVQRGTIKKILRMNLLSLAIWWQSN